MKKILLTVMVILCSLSIVKAQDKTLEEFERYTKEKRYSIDGNNIIVLKIVEDIPATKDEIYSRARAYFSRAYGDSNSVIQTDDKENGLIIGKGLYTEIISYLMNNWYMKAYHIIRIDIKDGRARIICSVKEMIPYNSINMDGRYKYDIISHYPFTDEKVSIVGSKKPLVNAFTALVDRMEYSVDSIAEALKEGGVLSSEKEEW